IDTHSKALKINLDPRWYGTFAEIGAGQEVVRWFFRVGGAAGTIAKSMSAYDMKVSDAIYGHAERYVSRGRLQAMLDREFDLDVERLGKERGDNTSFFAFADTVVARSYRGGIEFRNVDNRIMALKLGQLGLSGAAMFGANREVLQPSDVLHNKAVLVERGSFRPTTYVNLDMLQCALAKFKEDPGCADKPIL